MSENPSSRVRTRHIDTRYNFIHEHVEDGFIKIIFVRINDNYTEIFIKSMNMRSMLWCSLESDDMIEWCVIAKVLERITYIQ
jgi:hypothetical protein